MDFCANISLKEVLKELCSETVWKYAVFWRLNHGTHQNITWEDGYLESVNAFNMQLDFNCEKNARIEEIFLDMCNIWYPFGEGTVGEFAITGQHQWIFANQYPNSKLLNHPHNWKLQFLAGIKTILFVPIATHGVVQLGSLHMVLEDSKLVTQIRDLFSTLHQISATPSHDLSNGIKSLEHLPVSTTSFLNLQFSPELQCDFVDSSLLESQNEGAENSTSIPSSEHIGFCLSENGKNQKNKPQIQKRKTGRTEVKRRRPKDRQLIQDRIKELRQLIPNGSKCSIDVLLEKTVKQMVFLENISTRAKKLKISEFSTNKWKSQPHGDTWMHIQEGKIGICPLIVEDADQSGHILIEEYDVFLEIARIIRSLQLTILAGNLETRFDKLWARFVIEVSEEFNKMHIMWPLMQLLWQNSQF